MLDVEVIRRVTHLPKHLHKDRHIFRMHPLPYRLDTRRARWVLFEDGVSLTGPENFSVVHIPPEAAGLAKRLRLRQILSLAFSEQFFRLLSLRDVVVRLQCRQRSALVIALQ